MTASDDDQWIRDRFAEAVPDAPAAEDRMSDVRARRGVARRRRAVGVVLASCLPVVGVAAAVPQLLGQQDRPSLPSARRTPTGAPTSPAPILDCPAFKRWYGLADRGPARLARGATLARLCGAGGNGYFTPAPLDQVTSGLDRLVDSVNAQPRVRFVECGGPMGDKFLLLLGYPDGSQRHVLLSFQGCRNLVVGGHNRVDPFPPYEAFLHLVRHQRATVTPPPGAAQPPGCLVQYASYSPLAKPTDMVTARLCVTYADNGRTTSTIVPKADLRKILDSWATGPRTPDAKTDPCPQTTPTWVLSGVTQWGDPVQITAECERVSHDDDWVTLSPQAKAIVDRLVERAGVSIDDGTKARSAWLLAQAWITDVNARAITRDAATKAHIATIANGFWVRDPWLPADAAGWYLDGATRTSEPGWSEAWRIPARTPDGEVVFVVVRSAKSDPWRILSLTR